MAKSSFRAAIDGKLSNWYVDGVDLDTKSNRVEQFQQDIAEVRTDPEVEALPLDEVMATAKAAAQSIIDCKEGIKTWRMPCGIKEHREKLFASFKRYDAAMVDLETYAGVVDGLIAKQEVDDDVLKDKAKKHIKKCRDALYNRLCTEGVPKIVAKVAFKQ